MTIYPVTEKQYKQITGEEYRYQPPYNGYKRRYRKIQVNPDLLVAMTNKGFIDCSDHRQHNNYIVGLEVKDQSYKHYGYAYNRSPSNMKAVIEKLKNKYKSHVLTDLWGFGKVDLKNVTELPESFEFTNRSFSCNWEATLKLSDNLMDDLEGNLQLLKDTRKEVAAKRRKAKAEAKKAARIDTEAEEIAQAVTLLKKNGLDVITVSK